MSTRVLVEQSFPVRADRADGDADRVYEFDIDPTNPLPGLRKVWIGAMLMALRDKAGRVTCRAEVIDGVTHLLQFTMTIGREEVDIAEPPAESLHRFVDAAHALITPGWISRLKWRFGRRRVVTGVVDLDWGNGVLSRWWGTCYRSGSASGAEFVHIGFPFEPATIPV